MKKKTTAKTTKKRVTKKVTNDALKDFILDKMKNAEKTEWGSVIVFGSDDLQ